MIRVILPSHLNTLAGINGEISVEPKGDACVRTVLDAIENQYPMLKGTIREHETHKRRPLVRFFACGEDISFEPFDHVLPSKISSGEEPFLIVGSIAGG
jgi:molybdopterin synthase sulfur carrier subunit